MKIAALIILSLLMIFLGVQIVSYIRQEHELSASLSSLQQKLTKAQADEASLQEENNYLANPANLEKELRTQYNYKYPGETMVIIVPGATSTTSTD